MNYSLTVLYCFLNAEIQNALQRQISKVPLLRSIGLINANRGSQHRFETERTFLPAQTMTTIGEEKNGINGNGMAMQEMMGNGHRMRNGIGRGGQRWEMGQIGKFGSNLRRRVLVQI